MAESYRGLTIKIGGDATKLNQALRSSNQAISSTESELRKLNAALKLDPTSLKAAQLQVGAFASLAADASARFTTLNKAMQEVGDYKPAGSIQSIRELAKEVGNVQANAAETRQYFNELTQQLASSYTELSKLSAEAAKVQSKGFGDNWTITTNVETMVKEMKEIPASFRASDSEIEEFQREIIKLQENYGALADKVSAYRAAWGRASNVGKAELNEKILKAQQEMDVLQGKFDKAVKTFSTLSGTTYKFDNKNVDIESIEQAISDITKANAGAVESTDNLYRKIASLKTLWDETKGKLSTANKLEAFSDLAAEAAKAEAKIVSLVNEMVKLTDTSTVARGMKVLTQELDEITARGSEAEKRMRSMVDVLSSNGENQGARDAAMAAYADTVMATSDAIRNLQEQIANYDDEEVLKLANSTQSVAIETANAKQQFKEAYTELKKYEGVQQELQKNMDLIRAKNPDDYESNAEYQQLASAMAALEPILKSVRTAYAEAKKEKDKFVQVEELRAAKAELEELYASAEKLAKVNFKPEIDVSAIEGIKQAIDAIKNGIFEAKGSTKDGDIWDFSEAAQNIDIANAALEKARNTYKSLSEASKKDPTNSELIEQKAQALEVYINKLKASISAFNGQIEAIPSDKLDEVALSTNTVTEAFMKADAEVDKVDEAIRSTEAKISELEAKRDGLELVTPEAIKLYDELDERIGALRNDLHGLEAQADVALEGLAREENTRRVEDARTNIQSLQAELHKVKAESEDFDVTPKYDENVAQRIESAFKQIETIASSSVGMNKQLEEIQQFDSSIDEAIKRVKIFDDALKAEPDEGMFQVARFEAIADAEDLIIQQQYRLNAAIKEMRATKNIDQLALSMGTVSTELAKAKQQLTNAITNLRGYEAALKKVSEELNKLEKKSPADRSEDDKKKIAELTAEYERLQEAIQKVIQQGDQAFDNVIKEQNTQTIVDMSNAYNQLEQKLAQLGKTADDNHKKDGTPKIDEAAFMQAVSNITQTVKRMGQEIVQSSDEIDKAFRDMTKTVNAGEEQLSQLKDTAIEYSQTHITSADTMLEMQALGGQLGIAAENLEKFGKIASNLDIATDMDAETIALKLGQISNILGLDIDGMEGFSDALVRLGNNMPAQESAIMAVAQRFGAVAATASFSSDEVLAWSASIAATGQRSEAAATAISNTVSGIEQAVANGGNDLKQFAAIASMSAEEFKQSWKDSPTETLRAFIQGLETLKDSDESAVAALENMGITGVRQQQTLLALTQTIDNLDDALLMSSNAWNGISDQWGNAGDAANEAEKKSQGFSGALAIMQNNAQNLGAALGEGLIPFMNIASDLMGILTDALNSMSPTLKTITVFVGGLGIAFGTVIPVISAFSKGIGAIVTAAGSASSIGAAVTQVLGLGTAMEGAAGSATLLGGAMGGPVTLGVMAAVGALAYGISMIADYCAEQEELRQATEGLVTAMNSSDEAYSTYISGADESTRSVAELRDAINDATAAQANYAKTLSEAWGEIGNKEATVDTYVGTIEQLTSKTHLSEEEQKKLALAVEAYNNLTGDSVHIIDAQKGVLDKNAAAIVGTADAWKDTLENEQAIKQYGDSVSEMAKQQELLDDTNAKIAERGSIFEEMIEGAATARDEYYELAGSATSVSGTFMSMVSGASNAARSYYDLDVSAAKAKETIKSQADLQEETAKKMGDIGNDLLPVEEAFRAVGRSLTEYGSLTDEECDAITKAFNDSSDTSVSAVDRVINAMNVLRASAGNASEIANQLAEASKEAIKERYNAAKASFKEEYNNLKRQLDADYKAQQRAFNQEYKAQQKAYDAEYKAQQKAYDAEYKAQQKEYDKQYKALQKKLDNEYKARKKAYDDQLKALKKSQSDEVDAFKKATDAKLKEMEKEYKQRVKNLELQYGGQTDDIDEQIKQLKGETEAEKKAIEERKENEKIGELQKEVDRAKSRRKRAEAEKALNDYLTEIEQKRNEESREAQITQLEERKDQLKDELADRKEQLKAEYDAEVEAYKERRAAELEAMQEANTLEYEAKQEYYNTQLEQLKEAQTAQLETTKEAQQAALESLKESQQASLEALKDSQQEQLEAMKENQQIALENMKNDHNIQLEQTKADQDARLAEIKKGLDAELDEIEKSGDEKVAQTNKTGSEMSDAQYRHLTAMEKKLSVWGNNTEKTTSETGGKVVTSVSKSLDEVGRRLLDGGDKAVKNLDSSLKKGEEPLKRTTTGLQTNMIVPFQTLGADALRWGADMIQNLSNGIANEYNRGYLLSNVSNIASGISSYLHFSVPDKGPLATEDEWGGDMVQNLIDGMRSKERDLLKQTKRMADIIEDGFNPSLTVDAAYEAIDTINQRRSSALSTMVESKNTPNININLNMNLSNVSIRDDSDIEKLAKVMSQEMATQAARQLAGRLG